MTFTNPFFVCMPGAKSRLLGEGHLPYAAGILVDDSFLRQSCLPSHADGQASHPTCDCSMLRQRNDSGYDAVNEENRIT
jgi:hypothetical protein